MARVPTGIRTERGVEAQGLGKPGSRQIAPGDLPIPGAARDPGLSVNPNQFGAQIGGALQGLGQGIGNIAAAQKALEDRRQAAETGIALTRAGSKLNQRLFEASVEAQGEFNPGDNFLDTMTPRFDQVRAEVLAEIQGEFRLDEEGLSRFEQIAEGLTGKYALRGVQFEHGAKVAAMQRAVAEQVKYIADSVKSNGDLGSGIAAADAAVTAASTLFTADQAVEIRSDAKALVTDAYLEGRFELAQEFANEGDFETARLIVDELREAGDDGEARAVEFAIDKIEGDFIRLDDDLDEQRLLEMAETEGFDLIAGGEFSESWLTHNGPVVAAQTEADMRRALDVKNPRTQPALYADILGRATEPGAMNEALSALAIGALEQKDFATIYNASRLGGPALHFRGQIARELRPGQFDDGVAYVETLTEFDEFVAANPEASKADLRKAADEITQRGRQRVSSDLRANLPIPMFVPNTRAAINIDAVRSAATSLANAFKAGEMTLDATAVEAGKMRAWVEMLEARDAN